MKIVTERAKILSCLEHTQAVVERRNTIPILSNVRIEALAAGRLKVAATDLDLQIEEEIECQVHTPGKVTVSSQTLFDIVRKIQDGSQIQMTVAENKMTITAGRSRFNLPTLPADDFPLIATGELSSAFTMPAKVLQNAFDRARFAVSTEETRYYLNGIFVEVREEDMHFVATDGHRLAFLSAKKPEDLGRIPDIIIPRKCIGQAIKLLGEVDGDVEVSLSSTKIRFDLGSAVLTSKLIDGTFPDYRRVIPTNNSLIVTTGTAEIKTAIDRVSTIASEKTRAVKMRVERDRIELSVTSPENGTATDEAPASASGGSIDSAGALEIGFNSRYLIDILNNIDDDTVEFQLGDSAAPALVRGKDSTGSKFVIMPMRI